MRGKKAKKASASVRYLLSADRKLQKLSLKKISERVKTAKPSRRPARAKKAAVPNDPVRFPISLNPRWVVLGAVFIVAAATMTTARQRSDASDVVGLNGTRAAAAAPDINLPAPLVRKSETAAAARKPAPPAPATPKAEEVKPAVPSDVQQVAPVTITGCLVLNVALNQETFWLKDPSGDDVPKARSWRSGFLKKKPQPIELVDPAKRFQFSNYVGQRVAVTGVLTDRKIRAQSVKQVASSCK